MTRYDAAEVAADRLADAAAEYSTRTGLPVSILVHGAWTAVYRIEPGVVEAEGQVPLDLEGTIWCL